MRNLRTETVLWTQYMTKMDVLRTFIEGERTEVKKAVRDMLPLLLYHRRSQPIGEVCLYLYTVLMRERHAK